MTYRPAPANDYVITGTVRVKIHGYGKIAIQVQCSNNSKIMMLRDAAYCHDFACNVVSLRELHKQGFSWHTDKMELIAPDGHKYCDLEDRDGQFVLEYVPKATKSALLTAGKPSPTPWVRRVNTAPAQLWHGRLGHPGPEAISHLPITADGVKLRGPLTIECVACGVSKAHRIVRRDPKPPPHRVGERFAVDSLELTPDNKGYKWALLFTERASGMVFAIFLAQKDHYHLNAALGHFLAKMRAQYGIHPAVLETDGEWISKVVSDYVAKYGLRVEPCARHIQAQNGGAERSGGSIKAMARTMRTAARFPEEKWVEIYTAAVYLHNRIPKQRLRWQSPYEIFHTAIATRDGIPQPNKKPSLAHIHNYGCRAYTMSIPALTNTERLSKLRPKAWIGYLIGYDSTNIYRIWNPKTNRVIRARDVTFNEEEFLDGSKEAFTDELLSVTTQEMETLLKRCEIPSRIESLANPSSLFEEDEGLPPAPDIPPREREVGGDDRLAQRLQDPVVAQKAPCETDHLMRTTVTDPLLTPGSTPPPAAALVMAAFHSPSKCLDG